MARTTDDAEGRTEVTAALVEPLAFERNGAQT
jgi:hypothetical protein